MATTPRISSRNGSATRARKFRPSESQHIKEHMATSKSSAPAQSRDEDGQDAIAL
jgi:hypothetical protein